MRLSEGIPFKICANPQAHDQNINRAPQTGRFFSCGTPNILRKEGAHTHLKNKAIPEKQKARNSKKQKTQGGPGSVRFGYGLGMERFERFRFSVPAVPLRRGFLCVFSTASQRGRFRFRFQFLDPEPQNSQSEYFIVWHCLADCFIYSPFSLMKFVWWSWASGYQTILSFFFCGKTTTRLIWCGENSTVRQKISRQTVFLYFRGSGENGSGGSGSAFGSCENGSGGSGFRFRFGSWATLKTSIEGSAFVWSAAYGA